ncbi:MAG TPA: hypothetical protein VK619_11345 [Pyrinomonadaceae bacterium]|nr:hypothetical protein [Pyrinomonadaceae bacterium]
MTKAFAVALSAIVILLHAAFQSPVPVESEPRHHLKFENQYVRVFDVMVPPNDATLFHTHSNDYVFVTIGGANLKAQVMGAQPVDLNLTTGEVRFSKASLIHRITNVGSTPFHNITVEILSSPGSPASAASLESVPGHTLVLENERVRIYRLVLEPGQSTGMHTHALSGLGIAVSAGDIEIESQGQRQTVKFKPGEFRWHTGATTHSLKNVGSTRFEAVDIEWK